MKTIISSINYCPVKSLSFQRISSCNIKKDIGIIGDRIFAFSKNLNIDKAKLVEKYPKIRKLNDLLSLKNSPILNKYNFTFIDEKLTLNLDKNEIISINSNNHNERLDLCNKLLQLESSLNQSIFLLNNQDFPFFDTTHSNNIFNSLSLINLNSIKDFESKIEKKIEPSRFRANFYVKNLKPWEERNWIGKSIKINNINFTVKKNIPRCVAINLKPQSNDNCLNLLQLIKKYYNHFDFGVYLAPLNDGTIYEGNEINI